MGSPTCAVRPSGCHDNGRPAGCVTSRVIRNCLELGVCARLPGPQGESFCLLLGRPNRITCCVNECVVRPPGTMLCREDLAVWGHTGEDGTSFWPSPCHIAIVWNICVVLRTLFSLLGLIRSVVCDRRQLLVVPAFMDIHVVEGVECFCRK